MKGKQARASITVPTLNLLPHQFVIPAASIVITLNDSPASKGFIKDLSAGLFHQVIVFMTKQSEKSPERLSETGVLCEVARLEGEANISLFAVSLAEVIRIVPNDSGYNLAEVQETLDEDRDAFNIKREFLKLRDNFQKFYIHFRDNESFDEERAVEIIMAFEGLKITFDNLDELVWRIMGTLPGLKVESKKSYLESRSLYERVNLCIRHLRFANIEDDPRKTAERSKNPIAWLEKRIRSHPNLAERFEKLKALKDILPESAMKTAMDDFRRLLGKGQESSEYSVFMDHLDFLLDLPWTQENEQEKSIETVQRILNEDHAALSSIKESLCDYIAPKILNPKGKAGILCLIGPPGVGKTSIGKSSARALNRKFVRMSVGGIHDEAEIRGHRSTYIGALPGMILKLIKQCGSKNPVFMIDEIDKVDKSVRGDPSSALLEVLDPEQNHSFYDHYLGAGFDLSQVFFICTANVEYDIPEPLRDRMDIIRLPGYTEVEKVDIAKRFLIPKALLEVGLSQKEVQVSWPDEMISKIIVGYTKEAGVRELERRIMGISRKLAGDYLKGGEKSVSITSELIESFLGLSRYVIEEARPTGPGVAIGLAWTQYGGEVLRVQSRFWGRDEKFEFSQTGLQKEVMREANKAALTIAKGKLTKDELANLHDKSLHIHIPDGAIPKDGPSAGITAFCSIYSLFSGKVLRPFLAMTGEIDLEENVLPIGGIKEKVIAAMRAGIKEIILPRGNERNIQDVPKEVKESLKFHFVSTIDEAIRIAFEDSSGNP